MLANGWAQILIPIPNDPVLAGAPWEVQRLVFDQGQVPATSNAIRVVTGF